MAHVSPVRVVLVDDDPLVREGLRLLLCTDDVDIVGEASDGATAVDEVAALRPDVVLMDIRMPGVDGITATERIRRSADPPVVIMLTTFGTDDHVVRALQAGAAGFLLKDTPPADLVAAIRRALDGDPPLSAAVVHRLIAAVAAPDQQRADARARLAGLTERELAVADGVAQGWSNAKIAQQLYVSVATVKTHVGSVMSKLGTTNRVQIALVVHHARHPGVDSAPPRSS